MERPGGDIIMNMPHELIRAKAKGYFEIEFIESYLKIIEKWAVNSRKWFFQVTQQGDKPTLEFGCITAGAVFDATTSVDDTITTIMLISSLKNVRRDETKNSTRLLLSCDSERGFNYSAVTEEYREQLRQYADFIESTFLG